MFYANIANLERTIFRKLKYLVLADFAGYAETQQTVARMYQDQDRWTRMSILNTANMGKFSSDRAVLEYAEDIWGVTPAS